MKPGIIKWFARRTPLWILWAALQLSSPQVLAHPLTFDGVTLGASFTPAELAELPQRFKCMPQAPDGRYQICVSLVATEDNTTSVMLLDGRVEGILRSFTADEADAVTHWAVSMLGTPTGRKTNNGQLDLLWEGEGASFARLVTRIPDMDLNGGFLIMSTTLDRYLLDNPELEGDTSQPERQRPKGMKPGNCLAMPMLCPAA